jgi:hypothetical protein
VEGTWDIINNSNNTQQFCYTSLSQHVEPQHDHESFYYVSTLKVHVRFNIQLTHQTSTCNEIYVNVMQIDDMLRQKDIDKSTTNGPYKIIGYLCGLLFGYLVARCNPCTTCMLYMLIVHWLF